MSENKTENKPAPKGKKGESAGAANAATPIFGNNAKPKREWTIQACKKAAGRFTTEEQWAEGAPSSYKVATSRGWINECLSHMSSRHGSSTSKKRTA